MDEKKDAAAVEACAGSNFEAIIALDGKIDEIEAGKPIQYLAICPSNWSDDDLGYFEMVGRPLGIKAMAHAVWMRDRYLAGTLSNKALTKGRRIYERLHLPEYPEPVEKERLTTEDFIHSRVREWKHLARLVAWTVVGGYAVWRWTTWDSNPSISSRLMVIAVSAVALIFRKRITETADGIGSGWARNDREQAQRYNQIILRLNEIEAMIKNGKECSTCASADGKKHTRA